MKKVDKNYKIRIYPNQKQTYMFERDLNAHIFVYNKSREIYELEYKRNMKENVEQVYGNEYFSNVLEKLLEEYPHLKEINITILISSYHSLINAIGKYKQGVNRKPNEIPYDNPIQSFKLQKTTHKLADNKLYLEDYGCFKLHDNRKIEGKVKSFTIKKQNSQWFVVIECNEVPINEYPKTNKSIGIDLGIINLITLSNGKTIKLPDLTKIDKKIKKINKCLAKERKNSVQYNRNIKKLHKAYNTRNNIINDCLEKASTYIAKNYDFIAMESLNIRQLMSIRRHNKNLSDGNWFKLTKMIEYKANLNNKTFVKVPSNYPSSQLCYHCGYKNKYLKLKVREWKCPKCRNVNDRDVNAALNILKKAQEMFKK